MRGKSEFYLHGTNRTYRRRRDSLRTRVEGELTARAHGQTGEIDVFQRYPFGDEALQHRLAAARADALHLHFGIKGEEHAQVVGVAQVGSCLLYTARCG